MSLDIASTSLRKFSACLVRSWTQIRALDSLVTPSTSAAIFGPNCFSISSQRDERVLDRVVQQRGDDGRGVELQLGQDAGDFERMGEIGIARGALLLAMRLHGVDIGAVEQRLVRLGIVALTLSTSSYWRTTGSGLACVSTCTASAAL